MRILFYRKFIILKKNFLIFLKACLQDTINLQRAKKKSTFGYFQQVQNRIK